MSQRCHEAALAVTQPWGEVVYFFSRADFMLQPAVNKTQITPPSKKPPCASCPTGRKREGGERREKGGGGCWGDTRITQTLGQWMGTCHCVLGGAG